MSRKNGGKFNKMARKVSFSSYLTQAQYEKLKEISNKTSVPMSIMIRKAVDKIISEDKHGKTEILGGLE